MSKHECNEIEAAYFEKIELTNGHIFKDCYLDPFIDTPPGFIALRPGTITEGEPVYIKYVKVSNIACFNIEEREAGKLWQQFNPLPETVTAKKL